MQNQFKKVEKRKVEKCKGFVLNVEKSKSKKGCIKILKSIFFDFLLFDFLFFLPKAFSAEHAQLKVQNLNR